MAGPSTVTIEDVANWLGLNQRTDVINKMLQRCLNATVVHLTARLGPWVPDDPWPDNVQEATVMQAARVYKRKNSPEGVAGFGDLGVVRVTMLDPDVESLVSLDLAFHIGGALPEPAP